MAYELCKFQIQSGVYDKDQMKENLILFKMTGDLTAEQYLELNDMINPKINISSNETEEEDVKGEIK